MAPLRVAQEMASSGIEAEGVDEHLHLAGVPVAVGREGEAALGAAEERDPGVVRRAQHLGGRLDLAAEQVRPGLVIAPTLSPWSARLARKVKVGATAAPAVDDRLDRGLVEVARRAG